MATVDEYELPADRWYDPREHLWVRPEPADVTTARVDGQAGRSARAGGMILRVGVDALGQALLGQVVYIQLVEAGVGVRRGEAVGSLEAEKMVRPVLAPVSGTIVAVNAAIVASPRLANTDPYGQGWFFRVRPTDWDAERPFLLHGDEAVTTWARAEIEASR